jgi:hypothetical protein
VGEGGGDDKKGGRDKDNKLLNGSLGSRIEKNLKRLEERSRVLLEENRLEVLAVAHALERFKTLTGEDVLAIIENRPGPFIDGRRYHTDEFRQMAEEYHQGIVDVHAGRRRGQIVLPVLAGVSLAEHPPELTEALADHTSG